MALPSPPPSQRETIFTPVAGRNAHLFQPPRSPASVAATPSYATSADYFTQGGSRKRSRADSSQIGRSLPSQWTQQTATTPGAGYGGGFGHSSVNERYRLAGGFDTPGLAFNTDLDSASDRDGPARRQMRDRQPSFRCSGTPLAGPLARDRNGMARMPSSPNGSQTVSWTAFAFSLVGKAFNFGSSVFKGFYAGGGTAYNFDEKRGMYSTAHTFAPEGASTPLPGSWGGAGDDFLGDFEQDNPHSPPSSSSAQRPANKRRQTDRDTWVLVGTPDLPSPSSPGSPRRKSAIPRPALPPRPTASRASSRRSLLPRRTCSPAPPHHAATPDRRASVAHTRSPGSRPSSAGGQYLSPEAERYVKRQAKQDRAADKAMSSMSRQLEELIKQGQQALGTKFSVEGEGEDEQGFVDESW